MVFIFRVILNRGCKMECKSVSLVVQIHGQVTMLEKREGKRNGSNVLTNCQVEKEESTVEEKQVLAIKFLKQ